MSCQSNQCNCPSGSTWFWSVYANKCVNCPSGWIIVGKTLFVNNKNKLVKSPRLNAIFIFKGTSCYKVELSGQSWQNAENTCASYG